MVLRPNQFDPFMVGSFIQYSFLMNKERLGSFIWKFVTNNCVIHK